jgi:Flp pilus assembly protein TadG
MWTIESPGLRKAAIEQRRAMWIRAASCRQRFIDVVAGDERGQVLPWAALMMVMIMGASAFSIDLGHALLVRKQLQASADAAALAGAQHLADGSYQSVAMSYSAAGSQNGYGGYTVSTPVITTRCSSTVAGWGIPCTATSPNVVTVQQTAQVNTFFASLLGYKTLTVTATSAAAKGLKPVAANVAIVLDTTYSMTLYDSNCGATQLQCAENAIGIILQGLDPSLDNVSLFTFPAMDASTVQNDYNCSGQQATGEPYTFPPVNATSLQTMPITVTSYGGGWGWGWGQPTTTTVQTTYQITGFANDFRTSDSAQSLNSSSNIVNAVGQSQGCPGVQPNDTQNTYFAATIYQAQAALVAQQQANPGTANVMVILSDGNATAVNNSYFQDMNTQASPGPAVNNTSNGIYPNLKGQCGQAVDAALYATNYTSGSKADGTTVFTIAYGSPSYSQGGGYYGNQGNCASDIGAGQHPNITPCQDMQEMSSGWLASPQDKSHFYSDYYDAAQGDAGCQAADQNNTITSLNDIAKAIVTQLMEVRLISPNTP